MAEKHTIEKLNELLKGEQMAIQIYEKTKESQEDTQVSNMFDQFISDHKKHAEMLSQRIRELGGQPDDTTGFPGIMADIMSVINSIRGPHQLLKQIYDGEDKGIHAYEDRLDELDPDSQVIVKQIMNEDHEHLKWLKARMEKEKREKN